GPGRARPHGGGLRIAAGRGPPEKGRGERDADDAPPSASRNGFRGGSGRPPPNGPGASNPGPASARAARRPRDPARDPGAGRSTHPAALGPAFAGHLAGRRSRGGSVARSRFGRGVRGCFADDVAEPSGDAASLARLPANRATPDRFATAALARRDPTSATA